MKSGGVVCGDGACEAYLRGLRRGVRSWEESAFLSGVPTKKALRKQSPLYGSQKKREGSATATSYKAFDSSRTAVHLQGDGTKAKKEQDFETDEEGHLRRLWKGVRSQSWGAILP